MKSPQNQPEPQPDELDKILNLLDTKLHHADKSIFMEVAVNEGVVAVTEAKRAIEAWGRKQQEIVLDRANASLNGALYAGLGRKKTIAELRKEI